MAALCCRALAYWRQTDAEEAYVASKWGTVEDLTLTYVVVKIWDLRRLILPLTYFDLETRQPTLFVDVAAAGWNGYDKFPVTRYPRLAAYLEQHYRPVETRHAVVLYRRIR